MLYRIIDSVCWLPSDDPDLDVGDVELEGLGSLVWVVGGRFDLNEAAGQLCVARPGIIFGRLQRRAVQRDAATAADVEKLDRGKDQAPSAAAMSLSRRQRRRSSRGWKPKWL